MKAYLEAMEARLANHVDASTVHINALEARLMGRINDGNERVIERMRVLELSIASLVELNRSTGTMLGMIASAVSDLAGRMTRIEGKS